MAVYFPLEDQWMKDALPRELEKPSSHYFWELQEAHMPEELLPWRPLWFSGKWLADLRFDGKSLRCGAQSFDVFYCDAEWMRLEHLRRLADLMKQAAPIVFKRLPREPGLVKHAQYPVLLDEIRALQSRPAGSITLDSIAPILSAETPLDFWCRKDGSVYYLFISHPLMRNLRYPLPIGYSDRVRAMTIEAVFHAPKRDYPLELRFRPARSLLCAIDDDRGRVEFVT
jgi:hypothetical protein